VRELEFFHYHPGGSIWHRHDPRLKLLELSLWSIMALASSPGVMGIIALILIVLLGISGTRISRMRRPLVFWAIMAFTIILTAGLSGGTGSAERLAIGSYSLPFYPEGLARGALRAARLLTVLMAGQLLSATTDPSDLAAALRKILFFLPSSWSSSLTTAISLTLAFIPRILDEAAIIRDAAFSRGLGSRRSPLRRLVSLGLPMAEATLRRADLTTEALLSRCYSENPTLPELHIKRSDLLLILGVILPPLALIAASHCHISYIPVCFLHG